MKCRKGRFLKCAEKLFGKGFYNNSRAAKEYELLYPGREGQHRLRNYYESKINKTIAVFFAGLMLCIVVCLTSDQILSDKNEIRRGDYGQETEVFQIQAETESISEQVEVSVSARSYTKKQAMERLREVRDSLQEEILGENPSAEEVRYDLKLPERIDPGPVLLEWKSSDQEVINDRGILQKEIYPEEGQEAEMSCILSYEEYTLDFCQKIHVFSKKLTPEETFRKSLEQAVAEADKQTSQEETLQLPQEIDGEKIFWKEKRSHTVLLLLLLTVFFGIAVYWNEDQKLHARLKERQRQMEKDYSEILNKLVLLLGAGMTMRSAWEKISADYRKYSVEKHYVYEEILLSLNEMKSGISEQEAYEHFGRRCGSASYLKMSALLSSNLKKGTGGLLEVFQKEAKEALEKRKNNARKLGEQAGTKLLLPMIMMLGVVLMIIIVPAFRSIQM